MASCGPVDSNLDTNPAAAHEGLQEPGRLRLSESLRREPVGSGARPADCWSRGAAGPGLAVQGDDRGCCIAEHPSGGVRADALWTEPYRHDLAELLRKAAQPTRRQTP